MPYRVGPGVRLRQAEVAFGEGRGCGGESKVLACGVDGFVCLFVFGQCPMENCAEALRPRRVAVALLWKSQMKKHRGPVE